MRVLIYQGTSSAKKAVTDFSFSPIANSAPSDALQQFEIEVPDGWTVDVERDRLVRTMPSGNMEARRVHAMAVAKSGGFSLVDEAAV